MIEGRYVISVCGTRSRDYPALYYEISEEITRIIERHEPSLDTMPIICSGGCSKGADRFAKDISKRRKLPYLEFPADWTVFGNGAGYYRNTFIANAADYLIAVVNKERTGGTEDTINKFIRRFKGATEELLRDDHSLIILEEEE